MSGSLTILASAVLGFIHPALPLCLAYDYYLLFGYMKLLNQTVVSITLDSSKRHISVERLNFLGYETKPKNRRLSLRSIKYLDDYKNPYMTLDYKGLLPSVSRLMAFGSRKNSIKEGFNFKLEKEKQMFDIKSERMMDILHREYGDEIIKILESGEGQKNPIEN